MVLGEWLIQDEWFTEGKVEVHRATGAVERSPVRPAGKGSDPPQPLRRRLVCANLEKPLGGAAVELQLIDRLARADVAQLWRPVGGQHDQRHPGP